MSNLSQRLRKLEPGSHNQQYLEEVNLRLMRFAIKEKHRPHKFGIFTGDRAAESEVIYQRIKEHPRFHEMEREVLANLMRDEMSAENEQSRDPT